MLGDRPAPYPSSPARREEALDTLLNPHEVMLLPLTSDALHGYARASAAEAAERASVLGEDGGGSTQQKPARRMVEPWGSLLLGDQDQEEEEDLQDCELAEVVLVEGREEQQRAILQDVTRTRSGTPALRDERVRRWLQRSVSRFCHERGLQYVQGLTELAAPWALITDPPCLGTFSYRCFCAFVDRFAPNIFATAPEDPSRRGGHGGAFVVLETHLVMLEQLLRFHDPALAARLDKCCVSPAAYATPWFVTVFARQLPTPGLLHLWRRLIEYGDPVLHQFLALAWLVNSRRALLDAPKEDVPKAASSLRLQSTQDVDGLFGTAVALRAGTPRLLCRTLRRACYGGTTAPGNKPSAGAAGAAVSEERGPHAGDMPSSSSDPRTSAVAAAAAAATVRVSLLEGLRAAGVLLVDADQVADILLARHSPPPPLAVPESKEDGRCWGATRNGGKFVLVDCRAAGEEAGAAGGAARACEDAAGGRVVWRRMPPAKSIGREASAAAEVLREFGAGGSRGAEEDSGDGGAQRKVAVSGRVANCAPYGAGDADGRAACGSSGSAVSPAGSNIAIDSATHVCFIGGRPKGSRGNDGDGPRRASAAAVESGGPEFRLANAAARSCLAAHVCVLEGGLSALDEALSRRGLGSAGGASGVGVANGTGSFRAASRVVGSGDDASPRKGEPAPIVATVATGGGGVGRSAGAPGVPGRELPPASGGTDQRRMALAGGGGSERAGGGGGGPPVSPRSSHAVERKTIRLVGNRRVSEPFRVYAAKSADEMGRALRSLPLAASKPLEDAARVCNSLARTNVRALGDSRLSLSRSISELDRLNTRMEGTAGGFARYFGAGGRPTADDRIP